MNRRIAQPLLAMTYVHLPVAWFATIFTLIHIFESTFYTWVKVFTGVVSVLFSLGLSYYYLSHLAKPADTWNLVRTEQMISPEVMAAALCVRSHGVKVFEDGAVYMAWLQQLDLGFKVLRTVVVTTPYVMFIVGNLAGAFALFVIGQLLGI